MITHIIDSINIETKINIVSCHHEQSAGFAAEGYARNTGIPGVALATSGPGATNLITAIGSCYFDSVPTVFITGQVNTYELKKEKNSPARFSRNRYYFYSKASLQKSFSSREGRGFTSYIGSIF